MSRDISFDLVSGLKKKDATGQTIPDGKPIKASVIGRQKNVSQTEFYKAAQAGYQAEGVIEMNSADYSGQKILELNGEEYTIYRIYEKDIDWIEIYYGKRVGNQNG